MSPDYQPPRKATRVSQGNSCRWSTIWRSSMDWLD